MFIAKLSCYLVTNNYYYYYYYRCCYSICYNVYYWSLYFSPSIVYTIANHVIASNNLISLSFFSYLFRGCSCILCLNTPKILAMYSSLNNEPLSQWCVSYLLVLLLNQCWCGGRASAPGLGDPKVYGQIVGILECVEGTVLPVGVPLAQRYHLRCHGNVFHVVLGDAGLWSWNNQAVCSGIVFGIHWLNRYFKVYWRTMIPHNFI